MAANPTAVYLPARPLVPLGRLRRAKSDPALLWHDGPLDADGEGAETVWLKDGNPALAELPVEPLGSSTAKPVRYGWWHLTIAASLVFHLAAAWFLIDATRDDALIEGSENAGLTMRGGATAQAPADDFDVTQVTLIDLIAAKPVETATAEAMPVAETAELTPAETAEPVAEMVAETPASEMVAAEMTSVAAGVETSAIVAETAQATPQEQPAELVLQAPSPLADMVVADVQPATGPIEASTVVPEAAQVTPEEQPVAALPETIVAEAPPADISVEASTVQSEMAEVTPREQLLEIASETTAEEMLPVAIAREAPSAPVEIALVSAPDQPLETIATSPRDASTSGAVSVPPSEGPEIRAVSYAVPADETTVKLQLAEAVDSTDVVQAETIEVAEAVPTRQIVREAPEPAAVANYPGSVVSKLRSEVRYPLEAAGKRLKGEVHVAFIISADGNVSGINVVRSSGSSILDMAAMDIVRRSAPFPAIPAEAARSDWPLTVPFIFTRLGEQAQNAADPIVEGD